MRLTVEAHALTGQRSLSEEHWRLTVSNFSPFFWSSKVMETMSAVCRYWADLFSISFPFWKKRMFLMQRPLVFLDLALLTLRLNMSNTTIKSTFSSYLCTQLL